MVPSLPLLVAVLLLGFPPFLKRADESFQEFIDRVLQAHNEAGDYNNKLQGITSPQDPRAGVSGPPPPLPPLPPPRGTLTSTTAIAGTGGGWAKRARDADGRRLRRWAWRVLCDEVVRHVLQNLSCSSLMATSRQRDEFRENPIISEKLK